MATTALFAEILIVGLEASVWLSLLVLTFTGPLPVHIQAFESWSTLVTALILAAAYVLGILVDRVADIPAEGGNVRLSPADVADANDLLAGTFGPHIFTRSFGDAAGLSNRVRR